MAIGVLPSEGRVNLNAYKGVSGPYNFSGMSSAAAINPIGWNHLVATWDGTTNANGVAVYLNGNKLFNLTATAAVGLASNALKIGTYWNLSYYSNLFLDDLRIYSRALSASEIKSLYTAGR